MRDKLAESKFGLNPDFTKYKDSELLSLADYFFKECYRINSITIDEPDKIDYVSAGIMLASIREILLFNTITCYRTIESRKAKEPPLKTRAAARSKKILKLKKKGMQLHDIANELGCSISTVKRDLKSFE